MIEIFDKKITYKWKWVWQWHPVLRLMILFVGVILTTFGVGLLIPGEGAIITILEVCVSQQNE